MEKVEDFMECEHLVLCLSGNRQSESWNVQAKNVDYYTLKGYVEDVLHRTGIGKVRYEYGEDTELDSFATIWSSRVQLGKMGKVKKQIASAYDLQEAWFADFDWQRISENVSKRIFKLNQVPVYPAVRRDLALLLSNDVKYESIEKLAYKTEPELLREVNVFDVYTGDKIGSGKKSYAIAFTIQSGTKTLTDEEIEGVMNRLLQVFTKELGASLRA